MAAGRVSAGKVFTRPRAYPRCQPLPAHEATRGQTSCSLGLSATSQQYFSLTTNQPPATSQQYFSLRTNQHQPPATSQTNRLKKSYPLPHPADIRGYQVYPLPGLAPPCLLAVTVCRFLARPAPPPCHGRWTRGLHAASPQACPSSPASP
jgi:hypothetical protein